MIRKVLSEVKDGEILAENIEVDGTVLVSKDTVLKPEYIDILKELDIEYIYVKDEIDNYLEKTELLDTKTQIEYENRIKEIFECHIHTNHATLIRLEDIADELVNTVGNDEKNVYDYIITKENIWEHTLMVTALSILIAKKMNLSSQEIEEISKGAVLHDLGYRYIDVPMLNVDLDEIEPEQVFEYKKHTIYGYCAVEKEEWLNDDVRKIILSHHECLDGSGFPLKQKNMTLLTQIVAVTDTFDRKLRGISTRKCSLVEAKEYLKANSGIKYNKEVVDILDRIIGKFTTGSKITLKDGKTVLVIRQGENADEPLVILEEDLNKDNFESYEKLLKKEDYM
ncbi:HDIG domain-containing protein [Acetitomaculum ruminis DSM 5522]|uniref:HDIG domain-containing protein n=1 Tax=Acetitomaculum ruminis DSM 5522 TaxID=1120918 RepID=A0A1I0ZAS7_9FIRM|nr:HD domain-containing phosphohydrolase [Acetitomaculum ruminis]SFB22631.1 HDIG domain-containing protein [Acetitomaculum ruminis DSM 5522]